MDNDERIFPYTVWMVVARDTRTGKSESVDWGLIDLHTMSSDKVYTIKVVGTLKDGNLQVVR